MGRGLSGQPGDVALWKSRIRPRPSHTDLSWAGASLWWSACATALVSATGLSLRSPRGAEISPCPQAEGVMPDEATKAVPAPDVHAGHAGWRMCAPGGQCLLHVPSAVSACRSTDVVVQDQPQVALTGHQHPVQALTPCAGDPAFGNAVPSWRLDRVLMIGTPTAASTCRTTFSCGSHKRRKPALYRRFGPTSHPRTILHSILLPG